MKATEFLKSKLALSNDDVYLYISLMLVKINAHHQEVAL